MDGRITIRRIERDTLTHLNLAPETDSSHIFFAFQSNQNRGPLGDLGARRSFLANVAKILQNWKLEETENRPDFAFQFFTFPTNDVSMLKAVHFQ